MLEGDADAKTITYSGAEMALLVGRYVNKIDKKGRVSVPKLFRASIQGDGGGVLYVYPSFNTPAIEACGEAFMGRLTESLYGKEMFSDEHEDLAAAILDSAHTLSFDPEGRVVLPKDLIAHTGIGGEALFVGRGESMHIWEPAAHEAHRLKGVEQARARRATLPLLPKGGES